MSLTFPLSLKWTQTAAVSPAAWFIPGNNPTAWLEEIAGWNVPMISLRILVMPTSISNRTPAGIFVLPPTHSTQSPLSPSPGTRGEGRGEGPTPLAIGYGSIAGKLFLPIDSALDPPISPSELSTLLLHEFQVFHPSIGLVGFSSSDILRISDLISPPPQHNVDWNLALPGTTLAPRLLAVESDAIPNLSSILQSARDDIGTMSPTDKPDDDAPSPVKSALAKATQPALKFLNWISKNSPTIPLATNWIDALGHWASARMKAVDEKITDARTAELNRLIAMMEANPDQGLQYAIPLGLGASRGIAAPTSRLTARAADFNLSRLRGSGAADPWELPWEIRQRLSQQYRDAANRELALGRHRRAAYIFAELLGDYSSAANALRQGRHFREAAALYRDNLHNLRAAAECLEEGGQLVQAAEIYESQKLWEKAGDIYTRIDHPTDAARCWRHAVRQFIDHQDFLHAANLLETKLAQPDQALDLLIGAWPIMDRSAQCLNESFELIGRLGRHDRAMDRISTLLKDPHPKEHTVPLAQTLSAVARLYPSTAVRAAAADATRIIAGNYLPSANRSEIASLVQAVTRLAEEDRLLLRDGKRFISKQPERPAPYRLATPVGKHLTPTASFTIPGVASIDIAHPRGDQYFALGRQTNGHPCIIRGNFTGACQVFDVLGLNIANLFVPPAGAYCPIVASTASGQVINRKLIFPTTGDFPTAAVIESPSWLPPEIYGMSFSPTAAFVVTRNDISFSTFTLHDGHLMARYPIHLDPDQDITMAHHGESFFIAQQQNLIQWTTKGGLTTTLLPTRARQIIPSRAHLRARIIVTLDEGAFVVWPDQNHQFIAQGLHDPVATFLANGALLILSKDGGRAFRAKSGRVECIASFAPMPTRPIAAMPTQTSAEFAVITSDAQIQIYPVNFG